MNISQKGRKKRRVMGRGEIRQRDVRKMKKGKAPHKVKKSERRKNERIKRKKKEGR